MSLGTMEQIKKQAQELIEQAYQRGYKTGEELIEQAYQCGYNTGYSKAETDYHAKTEDDRQSSYELGLNMAWEAAYKLVFNQGNIRDVFDTESLGSIFEEYSATEAIEKIRAYEEKQKKQDDEIRVGDEVGIDDVFVMVTKVGDLLFSGINKNGDVYCGRDKSKWQKTGRHFDIESILWQMGGNE